MFREMRRFGQLLTVEESVELLKKASSGVLAVEGDEGYPYTVPMSFAYEDGKLFFHMAAVGHKLDSIARNDKVSFCVIAADEVVPETFTTHYRSVIVFGRARLLSDEPEKRHALELLAEKYSPQHLDSAQSEIEQAMSRVSALEVSIEKMTGKAARELAVK